MTKLTLRVHSPEVGYLNVRKQPTTAGALVTRISHGATVTALEPEKTVRAKVGQKGEWLHVRLDDNREVYAAAWYLELAKPPAQPPVTSTITTSEPSADALQVWICSPEVGFLNIRKAPSTSGALITRAKHDASVTALEPEPDVRAKVGKQGQWLKVRLADGQEGYAAAPYLSLISARPPDTSLEPPEEQKINITPSLSGTERQVALAWNRLGGLLQTLADQMGIDPGVAVAVLTVESGGRPFGPDGRMIIRFENHIFYDRWGEKHPDDFAQYFTFNSDRRWKDHQWRPKPTQPWRGFHGDQNSEWEILNFACTLDDTAARSSISMGGPQIMGFNHAAIGYTAVQQMFDAFAESERNQVAGFFSFVRSRGTKVIQMLQSSDFNGFARYYNGPGQAETYGGLIRKTYEAYRRLRTVSFGVSFAEPADVAPPPLVEGDDLQRILGIGPKTAARLQAEGIDSFAQLAALDVEQLRGLLGDAAGRARWLKTWPAQARTAAWGDWEALGALQAQLKS